MLEDIKNNEKYASLDLDKVNELIANIIRLNRKIKKTQFDHHVFVYLDLKKYAKKISDLENRLYSSPINPALDYQL